MEAVAKWLSSRRAAWLIICCTLIVSAVFGMYATQVEQDDDLLAFLPEGNSDIEIFYEINERFGGLDVALVGIEAEDVFAPEFLESFRGVTRDIRDTKGVDHVLSLANVEDFRVDPMGGIVASELIDSIPATDAERAALRSKVMARDQVVGNLVSSDGKAVLMYVFAAHGMNPRELANEVRVSVDEAFPNNKKYWGGAPFISTYIYDSTQADMKRLTPWAVIAIVVIILASFRDWVGSLLALFTTGLGIVVSRGAMGALGVSFNIVLSGMPVILFAVGSAYSIHILSRYYANAAEGDRGEALEKTLVETGPTVIAAGMTTVIGLLSFVTMDIAPMRTFGLFTALGIFTTLVLSVTFVPAVIRVVNLPGKDMSSGNFHKGTHLLAGWARRNRGLTGGLLGGVAVAGLFFIGQVDTRMDQSAFFQPGSPPDEAQRFLDTYFGGSQFLQVHVRGDLGDPQALRELQRLSDKVLAIDTVTQVLVISDPISAVNDAMEGVPRVPDTPEQVGALYGFLAGNAGARQLVTEDKTEALIHVKIGSNKAEALESVVAEVERLVEGDILQSYRVAVVGESPSPEAKKRREQLVLERMMGLSAFYGVAVDPEAAASALGEVVASAEADEQELRSSLAAFFVSEECFVEVTESQAAGLAEATVSLGRSPEQGLWAEALTGVLLAQDEALSPEDSELQMTVDDLMLSAESVLDFLWRRGVASARGEALLKGQEIPWSGEATEDRFRAAVEVAMMNLENPTVMLPAEGEEAKSLAMEINGLPVLYRGMSESVTVNQVKSLTFALLLVWVIMSLLFRSPISGLLATSPTALTLVVVYGGMGLRGVHLDIGTSMLGSIIIGAGVDYAVHLMAAWRGATVDKALAASIEETAPAIWTNAFMVAAGFFVLTLGEARPLQNVGGLTAVAMMVAAIMTFLAIPLLAWKTQYSRGVGSD
jgi:uncharacterized protein